ncbi:MAG: 50S ribosomal protein L34e [Candidatus Bathyarchaeia archaeon]
MPKPSQRVRSLKRVSKALPGGRCATHYRAEAVASMSCAACGKHLLGIPRLTSMEFRKLNRTRKKVSRIYGGQLCHSCLKTALKKAVETLSHA